MTKKHLSKVLIAALALLMSFAANAEEANGKKGKKNYAYFSESENIDHGLFTLYTIDDKLYFEIADSLLNKEILLGSRVSEISEISKVMAGEIRKNPQIISFRKEGKTLLMHHLASKYEGFEDQNIYTSLERHRLAPILEVLPIVTCNTDSSAYVVDVTSFFENEIKIVSPFNSKYKLGSPNKAVTRIMGSASYPKNIEVRTRFGYNKSQGDPVAVIMHRSLMLLPEKPMRPRIEDKRIGYFAMSRAYFDENVVGMKSHSYITKFDIYPKAEDIEKYKAGELVVPAKPIKYYIDNAFPENLQQALIRGIEYWQPAFEAIGFKDAITAQVYPVDDPEFNPDDIRYSCIRYVSQNKSNAMGPNWSDPRSGEVICGDVFWWHDVTVRLRNWIFVQCAAIEPKARLKNMDKTLLEDIAAYVVAHEVGHNLGLKHNMRASYAYPVDSLRSAKFTQEFGTTPSIMDYARFNYIAQPGDEGVRLLPPTLGVYDYHSIKWGYKPIFEAATPEEEYDTLNQWLLEKKDDPRYVYGDQQMPLCFDPAAQAEALGDDAVKASIYGVKNLKYIMDHLIEWTTEKNGTYKYMTDIHEEILKQHERYIGHVNSYIGGVYRYLPVEGEDEPFFTPVSKAKQQEALKWIYNEMLDLSTWAYPEAIERRIGSRSHELYNDQASIMDKLMSKTILLRLEQYHTEYSVKEYLDDLSELVWEKALAKDEISKNDRHLQATYVRNLVTLSDNQNSSESASKEKEDAFGAPKGAKTKFSENLLVPICNSKRQETIKVLKKLMKTKNKELQAHYKYLYDIISY